MLRDNRASPGAKPKCGPGLLKKPTSAATKPKGIRRVTFSDVVHIKPINDNDDNDEDSILTYTIGRLRGTNDGDDDEHPLNLEARFRTKKHKCVLCNATVFEEGKLMHLLEHVSREEQKTSASQYFTMPEVLEKVKKLSCDLLTRKACGDSCSCIRCSAEDVSADIVILNSTSTSASEPHEIQQNSSFTLEPKPCEFCDQTFPTKGELKEHEKRHCSMDPETCEVCGEIFQTENELCAHVKRHFEAKDLRKTGQYCTGYGKPAASGKRCDQRHHVVLLEQVKQSSIEYAVIRGCQPPGENQSLNKHVKVMCGICHQVYETQGILRMHFMIQHLADETETSQSEINIVNK